MCTVHRNRTVSRQYIRYLYCAHKQNTFQTVYQKCVLCTETEHFPDSISEIVLCTQKEHFADGTSEVCIVHRNRTLSRQYIRNLYCAHKQNNFQTVHQKCVLCRETEHFPDGTSEMCTVQRNRTLSTFHFTRKAVLRNHKTTFTIETQLFTTIHIYQHMQLTQIKSHT